MRNGFVLIFLLTSSAAVAAPCVGPAVLSIPRITMQRSLAAGSYRLHYENAFLGYAPQFGVPEVSIAGGSITVTQPVTDIADAGQPGAPAASVFCDARDVELPSLVTGAYFIGFLQALTAAGEPRGLRGGGQAGFVLDLESNVRCTTTRSFLTEPALSGAGAPVTVLSRVMISGSYSHSEVVRSGGTFTVTDWTSTEFPTTYVPYCLTTTASLGSLPAGSYTVHWKVNDFGIPRPEMGGSFTFKVIAVQGRRRAAQ